MEKSEPKIKIDEYEDKSKPEPNKCILETEIKNPCPEDESEEDCAELIKLVNNDNQFSNILLDSNYKDNHSPLTNREKLWRLFEEPASSFWAQILAIYIMVLIFVSCISFVVQTDLAFHKKEIKLFEVIETFCIVNFTIEYVTRLIVSPNKIKFFMDFLNAIDFLSILPYYIQLVSFNGGNGAFLRVLRLARVFRVFKISRYVSWIIVFVNAIVNSAQPLGMLLYVIMIALVFFSSILYFLERGNWNEQLGYYQRIIPLSKEIKISPFQSIPETFWWCIITMTTVGYGDVVPITWGGKILAGVCSLCGILVFAVPITVISKTFDAELAKIKQKEELGLGHVKQIKEKLIHAYRQGENRKSLYLNESGVSEKDREDTMVFLGKFLHGYEEEFDWDRLKICSANDLRSILSYYVNIQMKQVLRNANQSLEEKIQKAIDAHKITIEENMKTILHELPSDDTKIKCSEVEQKIEDCIQNIQRAQKQRLKSI